MFKIQLQIIQLLLECFLFKEPCIQDTNIKFNTKLIVFNCFFFCVSITNCQATSIESKGVPSAIADFVHQARMKAFEGGPLLNRYQFMNDHSEMSP